MQFTVTNDEIFYLYIFFHVNCYDDTLPLKSYEESKQCSGADGMQIQVNKLFFFLICMVKTNSY